MKNIARLLAVSGIVLATAMNIGAALADPIPEPVSAVVHVNGNCTGFHIGGGQIVTAGHCIVNMTGHKVVLSNGAEVTAKLVMFSDPRLGDDMALLRIAPKDELRSLPLACGPSPTAGVEVHMTGYPGYYGLSTVWGRIAGGTRLFKDFWRDAIPVNISAFGGFSGAPVMAADGRVVGILVGSLAGAHDLSVAVPAYRLCEMIGRDWLV